MFYNRCTGIYKFGNNTYRRRIRRRSNLGHIIWEEKCVLWAGKYGMHLKSIALWFTVYLRCTPVYSFIHIQASASKRDTCYEFAAVVAACVCVVWQVKHQTSYKINSWLRANTNVRESELCPMVKPHTYRHKGSGCMLHEFLTLAPDESASLTFWYIIFTL
jgi:hypothetical protein